jgi:hypothetical protein
MHRSYRQSGYLALAAVIAALAHWPLVASADEPVADLAASEPAQTWSPGPVEVLAAGPAGEDDVDNEFQWAGEREFAFLMSFDPDDEEVFLGWQVDF